MSTKPAPLSPTSNKGGRATPPADDRGARRAQSVAAIALTMSWQLLIVVVVPVWLGHWLDDRLHTDPWWTVAGLVLSLLGMILVVRQTIRTLNEVMHVNSKEDK